MTQEFSQKLPQTLHSKSRLDDIELGQFPNKPNIPHFHLYLVNILGRLIVLELLIKQVYQLLTKLGIILAHNGTESGVKRQ